MNNPDNCSEHAHGDEKGDRWWEDAGVEASRFVRAYQRREGENRVRTFLGR